MSPNDPNKQLEITTSRQWMRWMNEQQCSFAFTTYQAGKVFFIGSKPDGKLDVFERTFNRVMGMCTDTDSQSIYLSSLWQLWRFDNILEPDQLVHDNRYDRMFLPTQSWTTGDIDIHDIVLADDGKLYFVNSLFSCIATLREGHSFKPFWKPPFISCLVPEDRCHLNGLALRDGKPKYVTIVSQTDVNQGWREHRNDGGIVMDIETNEVIFSGLSMPHSPRWYNAKLYLHNSGTGEFGYIDMDNKSFVAVAFIPGYLRGLSFIGNYAIVGLSEERHNKSSQNLILSKTLEEKGVEAHCGLQVIDLRDGSLPHRLKIEGFINELYDVVTLPDVRMSYAVGIVNDEIHRTIRFKEADPK